MDENLLIKKLGLETYNLDFDMVVQEKDGSGILWSFIASIPGVTILSILLVKAFVVTANQFAIFEKTMMYF